MEKNQYLYFLAFVLLGKSINHSIVRKMFNILRFDETEYHNIWFLGVYTISKEDFFFLECQFNGDDLYLDIPDKFLID